VSMRVSRRVELVTARGRDEEPGNQPICGESPSRRRSRDVADEETV
jgi:hypothetical protein